MVIEISGKIDLVPIHASVRPNDVRHSCADIGKAHRMLGYSPKAKLEDYIIDVIGGKQERS